MRAYFNHPVDTTNGSDLPNLVQLNTLDDSLIAYINQSEISLDLTIYDFDNTNISSISAAINAAQNRGVQVRMISDGNQAAANTGISDLLPNVAHILSPVGGNYTIMHNKFVVIDAKHGDPTKPIVWTGSTNWTDRQINRDNNNVIIIQDQTLAKAYTLEFDEMWGSAGPDADTVAGRFGSEKTDNTPHQFLIGGHEVECYFSPSDNTNQHLADAIASANDSIHFATMLITRFDLAAAIDTAVAHGVNTQGYINNATTTTVFADISASMGNALQVNPDTNIIMHHKFCVVDAGTDNGAVWTGSHNWSTNATTRNDENSLFIKNAELADWYRRAFTRVTYPIVLDTTTVGIKNTIDQKLSLSIFPSVVSQLSDVRLSGNENGNATIQVMDQSGKLVYQGAIVLTQGMDQQLSMLNEANGGVYLIRVNSSRGSKTQQIIVTH
jgi:phosphatidylserine/phosphatidylglycerophosphate/cardiolipin synthase-like enzyme